MNFSERYMVKPGEKLNLGDIDPRKIAGVKNKKEGLRRLEENTQRLQALQYRLYGEDKRSLLMVLQGMDTAGKDGTIRHVMGDVNPQGCSVHSFKIPSSEEQDHDYLWRIHKAAPRRGEIGIFNRSQYEDVLVVRVHELVPRKVWSKRYDQINRFEKNLSENGTTIIKFFIHISKDEQRERLQARLDNPEKTWKFNLGDLDERRLWDTYLACYEDALARCSTAHAPWFVIPADRKWYRNLVVSSILVETLEAMDPKLPKPDFDPTGIVVE